MNKKKIHKMIIKLVTGLVLIVYFTTSGIIGFKPVKALPNNKTLVEYKIKNDSVKDNKNIKVSNVKSNLTQYGEKNMLTGKIGEDYAVHSWYLNRLNNLATAYHKELNIFSGYRSPELQQQLFNDSDKTGKMVARSGYSRHQAGLAIDCDSKWVKELNNTQLAKFGLYKPMDYEDWHIEPIETKGWTTQQLIVRYGTPPEIKNTNKEINLCEAELQTVIDKEIKRIDSEITSINKEISRLQILQTQK